MQTEFLPEITKGRDLFEDLTIDARKVLIWISKRNRVGWC